MTTPCPCGYTLSAHVHWTPPDLSDAERAALLAEMGGVA